MSAAGLGLALGDSATPAQQQKRQKQENNVGQEKRKRYAIVGVGHRSEMYQIALEDTHKEFGQLVAVCDKNPGRVELARTQAKTRGAPQPIGYVAADFDKMIAEQKPDALIVTTMCATHHEYIARALRAGLDVITEKPMTTTAATCQEILDAKNSSGKNCRVTFNYRYSPPRTQVKDILMSGAIGDILSVDFHWLLNTFHGADYFRRWHREKKNSGGLMVHKATHHFDLVNWWLGATPVQVMATGKREYYTPTMAKRYGLEGAHERCLTCPEKEKCGFYFDLAGNARLKALYLDNEKYDGYHRDQCVWGMSDIEDTMNVLVKYDNNITLAYSLNAFNAWEGYEIAFNGTKGRLEHTVVEAIYMAGDGTVQGGIKDGGVKTRVIPLRGPVHEYEVWTGTGGHGGGDKVMLDDLFLPNPPADKYQRAADERAGAASILIGIAANKCFETGQPVMIDQLVKGLKPQDFAPMPSHNDPEPMPAKRKV
jgi:predicted dehydrogenase